MRFTEINLFGVYVAPISLMMMASWLVLIGMRRVAARFGAMILHAVGMDGGVTSNVDEYVARAVAAAADTAALARERSELRQRIATSGVCGR